MNRIWNVRMNIDLLGAELAALEGDAEQAAWLRGYWAGVSGNAVRQGAVGPWLAGHAFGTHAREQSLLHQRQSAVGGRLSAASRANRQPEPKSNPPSNRTATEVQPPFEPPFEAIEESKNPSNTESQPAAAAASRDLERAREAAAAAADPLGMDSMQAAPAPRPIPRRADWPAWRQTHPRLFISRSDEDGSVSDWRALFDRAGPEIMSVMYDRVLPTLKNPRHGIGYNAALAWINANTEDSVA